MGNTAAISLSRLSAEIAMLHLHSQMHNQGKTTQSDITISLVHGASTSFTSQAKSDIGVAIASLMHT